ACVGFAPLAAHAAPPPFLSVRGALNHAEMYPSGLEIAPHGSVGIADRGNNPVAAYLAGVLFFQAEGGIRSKLVTGVQTCALPISPFSQREIRTRARPHRGLVRPRDGDQERAQGRERLELGHQRERLLDAHGRRSGHNPYSFIFRVRVLRWIPRISAAAPICPLVCASTRAMCRASASANVRRPPCGRSTSVASSPRSSSGRCSARSVSSVATITARSITLRSSRTLPTQAWARSSPSARSEIAWIFLPYRWANRRT